MLSKRKKIISVISMILLGLLTLIEIETFVIVGLPIIGILVSMLFKNSFFYISGVSRRTIQNRELLLFVPLIITSTICYLFTKQQYCEVTSSYTDLVFFIEDRGVFLNILIRGSLYICVFSFIVMLFYPLNRFVEIVKLNKPSLIILISIIWSVGLCIAMFLGIMFSNNTNGFTILQSTMLTIGFLLGSILLYFGHIKLTKILKL